jgi:hypothetical protein
MPHSPASKDDFPHLGWTRIAVWHDHFEKRSPVKHRPIPALNLIARVMQRQSFLLLAIPFVVRVSTSVASPPADRTVAIED